MLTVLYITARGTHPLTKLRIGQYDMLALSLAAQVDEAGVPFVDYELIVVDRHNSLPRRELNVVSRHAVGGLVSLRPRNTPWSELGAFAPNSARNTGLVAARGDVVVGLDDCYELHPRYLWRTAQLAADGLYPAAVLTQADSSVAYPRQPLGPVAENTPIGGVCAYPLDVAVRLNGWDERFDGCSGGDIDFTWRLRAAGVKFVRHEDVTVRGHDHGSRTLQHPRCERIALDLAEQRRSRGLLQANAPWTEAELDAWRACPTELCPYTSFDCDRPEPNPRATDVIMGYETKPWFDLGAERKAASNGTPTHV